MAAEAYHTVGPNNNILSNQQCDNQLFAYFWLRFSAISSCKANKVIVFMLFTLSSENMSSDFRWEDFYQKIHHMDVVLYYWNVQ